MCKTFPGSHSRCRSPSLLHYKRRSASNSCWSRQNSWRRMCPFPACLSDRPSSESFVRLRLLEPMAADGIGKQSTYEAARAIRLVAAPFPTWSRRRIRTRTSTGTPSLLDSSRGTCSTALPSKSHNCSARRTRCAPCRTLNTKWTAQGTAAIWFVGGHAHLGWLQDSILLNGLWPGRWVGVAEVAALTWAPTKSQGSLLLSDSNAVRGSQRKRDFRSSSMQEARSVHGTLQELMECLSFFLR